MNASQHDEESLRIAVARAYYEQDKSKVAIAADLGLSRFQVARMLADARRDGMVRIEIGVPGRVDRETSAALQQELGIRHAVVVSSGAASPQARLEHVATALAEQVRLAATEGSVVGVTWSSASVAMSERLGRLPRCEVVQLGGAIYPPSGLPGSVEVTRRVAAAAGTDAHTLYSPLVVADTQTAEGLRRQPEIASVLARAKDVDVAVLSVGSWHPSASAVFDLLTPDEQQRLTEAGVCGEISGRLFDEDGTVLATFLDDRVVGVGAATLRTVPRLVVSSLGAFRGAATRAACRAGLVHTLVVDDELARALLG